MVVIYPFVEQNVREFDKPWNNGRTCGEQERTEKAPLSIVQVLSIRARKEEHVFSSVSCSVINRIFIEPGVTTHSQKEREREREGKRLLHPRLAQFSYRKRFSQVHRSIKNEVSRLLRVLQRPKSIRFPLKCVAKHQNFDKRAASIFLN